MARQVNKVLEKFRFTRAARYNSPSSSIANWALLIDMKHEIPVRITVVNALTCVAMQVQKGKDELLPPNELSDGKIVFDFNITVDLTDGNPNFLGKFAQGPKDGRFVYVNSGLCAGQQDTLWDRRAKISLMIITRRQIDAVIASPGSRIEVMIHGIGRDGGPVCASVKGVEWKAAKQ